MIANWPSTTFTPGTNFSASATSDAANFANSAAFSVFRSSSDSMREAARISSMGEASTTNSSKPGISSVACGGRGGSGKSARFSTPAFTEKLVISDTR